MSANFIRGLHRVRVTFPIALSPEGNTLRADCIVMGAGRGSSTAVSSGTAGARFLEFYFAHTNVASAAETYGMKLNLYPNGTGSAMGINCNVEATSQTKGFVWGVQGYATCNGATVTDLFGVVGIARMESGYASGLVAGGKFAVSNDLINITPSGGVILLSAALALKPIGSEPFAYIYLQELGAYKMPYFIVAPDLTADEVGGQFVTATDATPTHALKCLIGGTVYYLVLNNTHA
jgi:hypothetical protein